MAPTEAITQHARGVTEPRIRAEQSEAPASPPPSLAGRSVLIDTYNLRLRYGSGIKTYGLTLLDCLQRLDASVSLLGDRNATMSRDPALAEVLFYDLPPERSWLGRTINRARRGMRHLSGVPAREVSNQYVIPDPPMRDVRGIDHFYNAPGVYDAANQFFKRFGRFTGIRPPAPVDIWHATTVLPITVRGARTITTIHDLIPLRLPYTTLDDKRFFYRLTKKALKRSDLVLTVSECSKRDVLRFFDVPEEKIVVAYQTIPFDLYERDEKTERALLERYRLDPQSYVLFVGTIEPKKNVAALIKAMSGLVDAELSLVIVGRKGWLYEEQLEPAKTHYRTRAMRKRIRLLDYVPSADLHTLYANAFCFAFPSLYEGFGLPPLEAMAHGCPAIVSNAASLPEICGDAALYCDPHEPETLRARIEELLNTPETRDGLIARGYERLKEFSPQRYAERLAAAYARLR